MKYIVDARCNHEIYCWCTV